MMRALQARLAVILVSILVPVSAAVPAPRPVGSMVTGAVTSQPIGHYEFCQKYRAECSIKSRSAPPPKVSASGMATVRRINASVNARYIAKTDREIYGREEVWAYPTKFADCEDYALQKRKELAARGFALSDLLMTVVRKPDGEGHAVLTLRTADGDFILDNLDNEVKPWYQTPYTFLKRQASFNTGRWVTIENGRDLLVGALR
ncbi:transglutaminase-like cysteine peptidase [Neorhizobium sp. CSC1952]|uniref:Predicted transglutaminase-like cysteine proteinase n=1 Tax=Xaviernesmea oryzae TaxID=464029 RepID=A0A1X7ET24_9HYPH|nr:MULTISPECIES: transglutaminase-like cysteine peptidase [Rhizobium/Agrobacterium group]WJR68441.1 transglutaminase-like cysteine peptidase [Rhizobium sp. CSC1952]SMF39484.1 Predicted transglutaminase-like cysteine proteinase [Xaviernesmea oryzae]